MPPERVTVVDPPPAGVTVGEMEHVSGSPAGGLTLVKVAKSLVEVCVPRNAFALIVDV